MAKYDVDKLYSQEAVTVREAAYLLGSIPNQNVYEKLENGRLEYKTEETTNGYPIKKVLTKSLYNYILKMRGELYRRAEKYRLPSIVPDNLKE